MKNSKIIFSCPSYIIPGTYLENIKFIDKNIPFISNIELLFYFLDLETLELISQEIKEIKKYNDKFSFSIHLPDDFKSNYNNIGQLFNILEGLNICNIIVHSPKVEKKEDLILFKNLISNFSKNFIKKTKLKINKREILFENLSQRDFDFINFDFFNKFKICLDIGHIYIKNKSIEEFIYKNNIEINRIKEVHFHGISENCDHRPFENQIFQKYKMDLKNFFLELNKIKKSYFVNIEVFNKKDFDSLFDNLYHLGIL